MSLTLTHESKTHPENFRAPFAVTSQVLGNKAKPHNDDLPILETSSKVLIIGAGFGGMTALIKTMEKLHEQDVTVFERLDNFGGTWYANTYPGVASDIPALWYSFSFALNRNWSHVQPPGYEIEEYILDVAKKYNLRQKTRFRTSVEKLQYDEESATWKVFARDLSSGQRVIHTANIVLSCQGALVVPNQLNAPGLQDFKGTYLHSAIWDHSVSFKDKNVVVVGNGCSAVQLIPKLLSEQYGVKSLNQVVKSKHYIAPPLPTVLFYLYKLLAFSRIGLLLLRWFVVLVAESRFPMFKGDGFFSRLLRYFNRGTAINYMKTAPKKYHDKLVPSFKIGCKRVIFDNRYIPSMHDARFDLRDEGISKVVEDGIILNNGDHIKADIIVACTGYNVNQQFLSNYEVIGRNKTNVQELWAKEGITAYRTLLVKDCPNFYLINGPNISTGHSSVVMALEHALNYYVKTAKPVIEGKKKSFVIKKEAYYGWFDSIQTELKKSVFGSAFGGCVSWYSQSTFNASTYPWSQFNFWWVTKFPNYRDIIYEDSDKKDDHIFEYFALSVTPTPSIVPIVTITRLTRFNRTFVSPIVKNLSVRMTSTAAASSFSREKLEQALKRRFFYAPAFEIYGGIAGLFDFGPPGCAFQNNVVDVWRKHFILEEDMLEVEATMLTPHEVLKTSGHVDRFSDWMLRDLKTGEIFRADHLVEEVLESRLKGDLAARGLEHNKEESEDKKKRKKKVKEIKLEKLDDAVVEEYEHVLAQIDGYSGPQLGQLIEKYNITNPATGGKLEPPVEFNLMFDTLIGPSGTLKGYLRPETAQGQFLNFSRLLDFNNDRMPFASATIGKSFRNEIAPRAGLLRVREFLMAEIEHYVDPNDKSHARFQEVKDIKLRFWPKGIQESGSTEIVEQNIGEAVASGMVDNETLGYFIARIYLFLVKIGINPERMRLRQHMSNEMAHYASDCWDTEIETSYGWIECVGCADRSAYDLTVHSARTNTKLVVRQTLDEPITVEKLEIEIAKKQFGPRFRKDAATVEKFLLSQTECELEELDKELKANGKIVVKIPTIEAPVELGPDLIKIDKVTRTEHVREYTPNVIEPSFGIGRIVYAALEHAFWTRPEDDDRAVLSLPPIVAPTKVLVVPLSNSAELLPIVTKVSDYLRKQHIPFKVDNSSASIGKRYARNDELGTPFGITVDFDSLKDESVTLRDRDSTKQLRGSFHEIIKAVREMSYHHASWDEATTNLSVFEGQSQSEA
ncbi:Glycine--tRNA ligase 1 mitochondrial [Spathaspora sp. JA1]|nr:Glycine--tRNA ligase 1 mitochondrial [Spathaspora sp. JA1]